MILLVEDIFNLLHKNYPKECAVIWTHLFSLINNTNRYKTDNIGAAPNQTSMGGQFLDELTVNNLHIVLLICHDVVSRTFSGNRWSCPSGWSCPSRNHVSLPGSYMLLPSFSGVAGVRVHSGVFDLSVWPTVFLPLCSYAGVISTSRVFLTCWLWMLSRCSPHLGKVSSSEKCQAALRHGLEASWLLIVDVNDLLKIMLGGDVLLIQTHGCIYMYTYMYTHTHTHPHTQTYIYIHIQFYPQTPFHIHEPPSQPASFHPPHASLHPNLRVSIPHLWASTPFMQTPIPRFPTYEPPSLSATLHPYLWASILTCNLPSLPGNFYHYLWAPDATYEPPSPPANLHPHLRASSSCSLRISSSMARFLRIRSAVAFASSFFIFCRWAIFSSSSFTCASRASWSSIIFPFCTSKSLNSASCTAIVAPPVAVTTDDVPGDFNDGVEIKLPVMPFCPPEGTSVLLTFSSFGPTESSLLCTERMSPSINACLSALDGCDNCLGFVERSTLGNICWSLGWLLDVVSIFNDVFSFPRLASSFEGVSSIPKS